MDLALALIVNTARALVVILDICLFLRAILSWLPISDDNPILSFLHMVTEPVIFPFRWLFDRLGWFQGFPLDMPFLFACMGLIILATALGVPL